MYINYNIWCTLKLSVYAARKDSIMKKTSALLIVLMMLLSVLTLSSCDVIMQYLPDLDLGGNGGGSEGGTVTKEEWVEAMSVNNYSIDITSNSAIGNPKSRTIQKMKSTESCEYILVDMIDLSSAHSSAAFMEYYYANIDGITHKIEKVIGGFEAKPEEYAIGKTLGEKLGGETEVADLYDQLTWDDESNCYKLTVNTTVYSISFESGKIKSLTATSVSPDGVASATMNFHSFGTTSIELPDYSLDSISLFTQADLTSLVNETTNFSVLRVVATGNETMINENMYTNNAIYMHSSASPLIPEQTMYVGAVDGVTYYIMEKDGAFIGYPQGNTGMIDEGLSIGNGVLKGNSISSILYMGLNKLSYDNESDSYKAEWVLSEDSVLTIEFTVKNGAIKSFGYCLTQQVVDLNGNVVTGSESLKIFDIGTTVVSLPEFTISDSSYPTYQ